MLAMYDESWKDKLVVNYVDSKGMCVFARTNIRAGQIIGYFEGDRCLNNTMYSLHLKGAIIDGTGILRNLAHSCEPNAYFKDRKRWLYAINDIGTGQEVTIDYFDSEPVISAPFSCKCGSPRCRGIICTPE